MRWLKIILPALLLTSTGLAWETRDGSTIGGKVDSFDFDTKALVFDNPVSPGEDRVAFGELSLRSQQRLLFSPIYHRSFPEESLWPAPKRNLLLIALAAVVIPLFFGFWLSGGLITRKINPVRALFGFAGSWVVGALLVTIYLLLAARFEGNTTILWVGFPVAGVFLSIFISAVYNCSAFKGFAVFISHLFAGLCLALIILFVTDILLPDEILGRIWTTLVFRPVGLALPLN